MNLSLYAGTDYASYCNDFYPDHTKIDQYGFVSFETPHPSTEKSLNFEFSDKSFRQLIVNFFKFCIANTKRLSFILTLIAIFTYFFGF